VPPPAATLSGAKLRPRRGQPQSTGIPQQIDTSSSVHSGSLSPMTGYRVFWSTSFSMKSQILVAYPSPWLPKHPPIRSRRAREAGEVGTEREAFGTVLMDWRDKEFSAANWSNSVLGGRLRRRCHVVESRTRSHCVTRNFRWRRLPRATCSSPRREACGAFEPRSDGVGR